MVQIFSMQSSRSIDSKEMKEFRNYDKNIHEAIRLCYKNQRIHQTRDFSLRMIQKYCTFERKATFWELFDSLSDFIDVSDPDINVPNAHHLFQTAESIRKDGHPEWFQVVGLIHDLGKVMYIFGSDTDGTSVREQWSIVGDTFITGCPIPNNVIFPEYNKLNKDHKQYTNPLGVYGKPSQNKGLNNVVCSFGHDEYLYRLLKFNKAKLPEEAFYMIRYHSLYLWHDKNEYTHFENDIDRRMKPWVALFNKYDLYTKTDNTPKDNWKSAREYYASIIKKYIPSTLAF